MDKINNSTTTTDTGGDSLYNVRRLRQELATLQTIIAKKDQALNTVVQWESFPQCTDEKGNPRTYELEYGSNGSRDHMRGIAKTALLLTTDAVQDDIALNIEDNHRLSEWKYDLEIQRDNLLLELGVERLVIKSMKEKLNAGHITVEQTLTDHARLVGILNEVNSELAVALEYAKIASHNEAELKERNVEIAQLWGLLDECISAGLPTPLWSRVRAKLTKKEKQT